MGQAGGPPGGLWEVNYELVRESPQSREPKEVFRLFIPAFTCFATAELNASGEEHLLF